MFLPQKSITGKQIMHSFQVKCSRATSNEDLGQWPVKYALRGILIHNIGSLHSTAVSLSVVFILCLIKRNRQTGQTKPNNLHESLLHFSLLSHFFFKSSFSVSSLSLGKAQSIQPLRFTEWDSRLRDKLEPRFTEANCTTDVRGFSDIYVCCVNNWFTHSGASDLFRRYFWYMDCFSRSLWTRFHHKNFVPLPLNLSKEEGHRKDNATLLETNLRNHEKCLLSISKIAEMENLLSTIILIPLKKNRYRELSKRWNSQCNF